MAILLLIILCKKIPVIGGNINVALLVTGALSLLMNSMINPGQWIAAWIDGLDRLSWVIALSIVGSVFAEISLRLGTIDTIIGMLAAKFGRHPRILVVCIMFALLLSGSLLGDAIASAAVIGVLTIGILMSMNVQGEKISAIIVMGASLGSIMPPMTQAIALSSSLVNTPADPVVNIGYITISIAFIIVCIYAAGFLVHADNMPGTNKDVEIRFAGKTASGILRENWKSLIPMAVLILIVLLRTLDIPYMSVDIGPAILQNIKFLTISEDQVITLYDFLSGISIVNGLTNGIVLSIICAIAVAFLFPQIRRNARSVVREGFSKVQQTVLLQVCCAFMLGSFYAAGSVDTVSAFAQGLDSNVLKIGGAAAMILMGMLTGSQSTTQNVVFSFFGPALVSIGLNPTYVAVAGAHLATAGQGLPPADLTTFVVVGIVGSQLGKKVDPLKSMIYSMPMCICLMIIGLFFLYI